MLTLFGLRLFRIVDQVVRYVVRGRCTSWIARSRVTRFANATSMKRTSGAVCARSTGARSAQLARTASHAVVSSPQRKYAEDVVIGGGNVIHMNKLPRGRLTGNNAHAFIGGFRMWNDELEDRRLRASAENFGPSMKRSALFSNLNLRRKK